MTMWGSLEAEEAPVRDAKGKTKRQRSPLQIDQTRERRFHTEAINAELKLPKGEPVEDPLYQKRRRQEQARRMNVAPGAKEIKELHYVPLKDVQEPSSVPRVDLAEKQAASAILQRMAMLTPKVRQNG